MLIFNPQGSSGAVLDASLDDSLIVFGLIKIIIVTIIIITIIIIIIIIITSLIHVKSLLLMYKIYIYIYINPA